MGSEYTEFSAREGESSRGGEDLRLRGRRVPLVVGSTGGDGERNRLCEVFFSELEWALSQTGLGCVSSESCQNRPS